MTHVTCRLTAKNRDQLRGTLRSAVEYGLACYVLGCCLLHRQAMAAGSADGDGDDARLGDADVDAASQRRRRRGDRLHGRVQVELVLRLDVELGGPARRRATLRGARARRRHVVRVPRGRREPGRPQRAVARIAAGRRQGRRRYAAFIPPYLDQLLDKS